MINHVDIINNNTIVAFGIFDSRNSFKYSENINKLVYIIDDKKLIGITGLFLYSNEQKHSYFITCDNTDIFVSEYNIRDIVRYSEYGYLIYGYDSLKTIKIVDLNEIIRSLKLYIDLEMELTKNSITVYTHIEPCINIGDKLNYKSIINNPSLIIDIVNDIRNAYNAYINNLKNFNDVSRKKGTVLLNYSDIQLLEKINNVDISEDEDTNNIKELYNMIENLNKTIKVDNLNYSRLICNVKIYRSQFSLYIKYGKILDNHHHNLSTREVLYKILKMNNTYDKFIAELKSNIVGYL